MTAGRSQADIVIALRDETLERDAAALRRALNELGFAEARVEVEVPETGGDVPVSFRAVPGPRTLVEDVRVVAPSETGVETPSVLAQAGAVYRVREVARDKAALLAAWQEAGYLHADVTPRLEWSDDKRQVRVAYLVEPGARARVGEIVVAGINNLTRRPFVAAVDHDITSAISPVADGYAPDLATGRERIYALLPRTDVSTTLNIDSRVSQLDVEPDGLIVAVQLATDRDALERVYYLDKNLKPSRVICTQAFIAAHQQLRHERRLDHDYKESEADAFLKFDILTPMRSGAPEVHILSLADGAVTTLAVDGLKNFHGAWNWEGTKIAFISARSGPFQVWTMNPDGSDQLRFSRSGDLKDTSPAWSPNGEFIVFVQRVTPNGLPYLVLAPISDDGISGFRIAISTSPARSPTWQFVVGSRSAPVDTSWGTVPDVNGDGFADVLVGAPGTTPSSQELRAPGVVQVHYGRATGVGATPDELAALLTRRVDDEVHQLAVRTRVEASGSRPTPVIDRFWFKSVYFNEP